VVLPEQRGDLGDREYDDEVEEPLRPRDAFALDDLRHGNRVSSSSRFVIVTTICPIWQDDVTRWVSE
jgi:hypothetical protein